MSHFESKRIIFKFGAKKQNHKLKFRTEKTKYYLGGARKGGGPAFGTGPINMKMPSTVFENF